VVYQAALLAAIGLEQYQHAWLADPKIALWAVLFVGFPWVEAVAMLIYYAGLQNMPASLIDASKIDGATTWRRVFSIDIPLLFGQIKLLMVVTIIYLPIVLPLLLQGVAVNPWDIAQSLIVMMLLPLAIGLFVNARYEEVAAKVQPTFGQASNIAILVLTVAGLVLNFKSMIGLVGSWGILAGVIFIVISLVIGYFLGGSDGKIKSVMGLGSGQRNISAALVVAGQNFGMDVVTYLMVIAVVGLVVLMPLAGELGKRAKK